MATSQITFDAQPVAQDTPVSHQGMSFDAQPVAQDTPVTSNNGGASQPSTPGFLSSVWNDAVATGKGVIQQAVSPAAHLYNAAVSLAHGDYDGAAQHFEKFAGGPADDIADSVLQSSGQAAKRMVQSAKQGDVLGAIQHGAGVVPGASQVDAAMTSYQSNPSKENLAHVVTNALPFLIPGALRGAGRVFPNQLGGLGVDTLAAKLPGVTEGTEEAAINRPSFVQQVVKGRNVAQSGTQAAVRSGLQASTEAAGTADESVASNITSNPILKGNQTVVDEPLVKLKDAEQAAYAKVDDAVGFDLKAEKAQLANDQYKLRQLGNTDTDVTQRRNLTESINDSQGRIDQATQTLKDAGIDPTEADTLHQQRMAGQDFKKMLIKNTTPDGNVNVDGLLRDSKNLRFNKYGDRLGQFMGKDAADGFVDNLQQMSDLGAHAAKMNTIAKWVGGGLATTAVGGVIGAKVAHVAGELIP